MAALACSTVSYETKAYPRDWPVSLCTATCEGGERRTLLSRCCSGLGGAEGLCSLYGLSTLWARSAVAASPSPPPKPAPGPPLEFETADGAPGRR